jgi:hypothetical protein
MPRLSPAVSRALVVAAAGIVAITGTAVSASAAPAKAGPAAVRRGQREEGDEPFGAGLVALGAVPREIPNASSATLAWNRSPASRNS